MNSFVMFESIHLGDKGGLHHLELVVICNIYGGIFRKQNIFQRLNRLLLPASVTTVIYLTIPGSSLAVHIHDVINALLCSFCTPNLKFKPGRALPAARRRCCR